MKDKVRKLADQYSAGNGREMLLYREQVARAEAEANHRLTFLAEASAFLASSLDYESTLRNVANQAVPYLADWCFIHISEEGGAIRCLAAAHSASIHYPEVDDLNGQWRLQNPSCSDGLPKVWQTGKSEVVSEMPDPWVMAIAANDAQYRLFRRLGFKAAVVAPMIARSRIIGALVFVSIKADHPYNAADLALCEDLARRCGFAADNARLYLQVIIERDRAEKANRAKDEFLAVLSHELRNPLMPIMGWARVLKSQSAVMQSNVLAEGVLAIERNAQNIRRLVEDCLDLARISEHKIRLEPAIGDFNEIATDSVGATANLARAKGLRVTLDLSSSPLWLSADRARLEQVIVNLMTNAIRYTSKGGSVTIKSRMIDNEVEMSVHDTGSGIAPDFLEQVFEPFRQGSNAWLSSESGLGLGLSIARQIIQLHQGRIWATSQGLGQGSSFFVRLPAAIRLEESVKIGSDPSCTPNGPELSCASLEKPLRVLLIDDAPDILFLTQVELEWLGYSVLVATDGSAGLEIAEREKPDAIISDIKIPGLDGYELIARIRQKPALKSIPAIALTGFGMKEDIQRALATGYDAHLIKPVDAGKISALLQTLVDRRKTSPDVAA